MEAKKKFLDRISDLIIEWIGSTSSIIIHSVIFFITLISHWIFHFNFDNVLLVLTTVVSLEAIYLSIFIQRSVNQHSTRLEEVEESLDGVEESLDDVEQSIDDVEESLDDVEESLSTKNTSIKRPDSDRIEKLLKDLLKELKLANSKGK